MGCKGFTSDRKWVKEDEGAPQGGGGLMKEGDEAGGVIAARDHPLPDNDAGNFDWLVNIDVEGVCLGINLGWEF